MSTLENELKEPGGSRRVLIILAGAFCVVGAPDSVAEIVENNLLENTLDTYETRMADITANIRDRLINTFYLLALIEFIWGMIKNYLDNGGLQTFLSEIITRIMFIGFFLHLFQNGTNYPLAIVNSFRSLATNVPSTSNQLAPDNLIDIGQNFVSQSWGVITTSSVLTGLGMMVAAIIVFIAMVILAAHMAVALLEFYVVGYGGFVLLAFGASRWTHGYAVSYLKYAMSIGMKLFILLIIVAVIEVEMQSYLLNVAEFSITNVWAVTAFALFSVVLAIIAPQSVMGMMSGVSVASGAGAAAAASAVGGAASTASRAAGGASRTAASVGTSAMGAASAGASAFGLGRAAASQASSGGAGAGSSALAGAGAVAKEIGKAATSGGSSALSKAFPVGKSAGGKLAARMNKAKSNIKPGQ